jgi:hypothetical protein
MNPKEQRTHRTITAALAARADDDEARLKAVEGNAKSLAFRLTAVEGAGAETLRLQTKMAADLADVRTDLDGVISRRDALDAHFWAFAQAGFWARLRWLIGGVL